MKQLVRNATVTKVVKDIDPVDVPAYKIKQIYLHRNDVRKVPKADTAPHLTLRARILSLSLFPNLYNKEFLLDNK